MAQQVRPWLMKPENVRAPIECAKAGGGQPAEPIRDSGLRAAAKVRMYGCNRYLSAASREEKPGKGWGRPCTDSLGSEIACKGLLRASSPSAYKTKRTWDGGAVAQAGEHTDGSGVSQLCLAGPGGRPKDLRCI